MGSDSVLVTILGQHRNWLRAFVLWLLVMVSCLLWWSVGFVDRSPRPGLEVAAILAAIWVPLNGLVAFVTGRFITSPGGP